MTIKAAIDLVKHDKVKEIGGGLYELEEHTVKFVKKPGRILFICTCQHHTKFCNSNTWCYHIIAIIIYQSKLVQGLLKILEQADEFKKFATPVDEKFFTDSLRDLLR